MQLLLQHVQQTEATHPALTGLRAPVQLRGWAIERRHLVQVILVDEGGG